MKRILIAGGTGVLGRALVANLRAAGCRVRVMSRQPPLLTAPFSRSGSGEGAGGEVEWAQADLATGAGLSAALEDTPIVIHAATLSAATPKGLRPDYLFAHPRIVDVDGTHRLIEQACATRVEHFLYVSIVGIDHFPQMGYYRHKVEAEQLVAASGLPWTILRATQFHQLLDGLLTATSALPLMPLATDFQFQPIDPGEVAERIRSLVADGPIGRAPDMGGPEVLRLDDMARAWLAARGLQRRIIHLPLPDSFGGAFKCGDLTCPQNKYGRLTWAEWLQRKYSARATQQHPA